MRMAPTPVANKVQRLRPALRPQAASSWSSEFGESVARGRKVCVVSMPGVHSRSKLGHSVIVKVVV